MTIFYAILSLSLLLVTFVASSNQKVSGQLFFVFGLAFALVVLLKPFGSSRDDFNYIELVESGCIGIDCGPGGLPNRDFIWFFLASLSPGANSFLIIKLVAVFSLLAKLFVIYRLTSNRLYSLCVYVFGFFFLHDLTQYRASLAISFFFLAIYFVVRRRISVGVVSGVASFGSHIQSALAIALPAMPRWTSARPVFFGSIAILLVLLLLGQYPSISWIVTMLGIITGQDYDPGSSVGKYIFLVNSGERTGIKNVSLIAVVMLFALWILKAKPQAIELRRERKLALEISYRSVLLGYLLYFVFASILEMQNRFFEFFSVLLVLIFGNCTHSPRNFLSLMLICVALAFTYRIFIDFFLT